MKKTEILNFIKYSKKKKEYKASFSYKFKKVIFLILLYTIYSFYLSLNYTDSRFQKWQNLNLNFDIYIEIIEYMLKEKKNIDQKIKINKI